MFPQNLVSCKLGGWDKAKNSSDFKCWMKPRCAPKCLLFVYLRRRRILQMKILTR